MTRYKNVVDLRRQKASDTLRLTPLLLPPRRGRPEPLRTRRRRTRLIIAVALLLLALSLAGAVSYVSHMPRFNVQTAMVEGASHVAAEDIAKYALGAIRSDAWHFLSPSNIFLYEPARVAANVVAHFPRIKEARISRPSLLATDVHIKIEERQPFALWCERGRPDTALASSTPENCYVLDDSGFIFALGGIETGEVPASTYVFEGGVVGSVDENPIAHSFAPSHMPGILAFLALLKESGFAPQGATVEGDNDFSVGLESGFYIKASYGASAEDLVKNLLLILESEQLKGTQAELEYIDLRFGNRVYYKLEGAQSSGFGTQ